jgi:hypothetical protein
MNNAINQVQRQYTYAVQPVKLFETKNSQQAQKNALDFSFISQMKSNGNNPFHPDVSNSEKGNKLDIMS